MRALQLTTLALAAVVLALAPTASASAAGAPGEVTAYIATDLVADLSEFYGVGADGTGVDFTDATTSAVHRVVGFTDDFAAGVESDPPTRLLNRWVTVVSIDETVIGLAVVSIEPVSVTAQLDVYIADPDFGALVAALPDDATLVDDSARDAWLGLSDGMLTPIVAGTSGLTSPTPLADYRATLTPDADAATAHPDASGGLLLAGLILVLIILLLAVEAFYPLWRRKAAARVAEGEPAAPAAAPAPPASSAERLDSVEPAAPTSAIEGQPVAKPRVSRKRPTASN